MLQVRIRVFQSCYAGAFLNEFCFFLKLMELQDLKIERGFRFIEDYFVFRIITETPIQEKRLALLIQYEFENIAVIDELDWKIDTEL